MRKKDVVFLLHYTIIFLLTTLCCPKIQSYLFCWLFIAPNSLHFFVPSLSPSRSDTSHCPLRSRKYFTNVEILFRPTSFLILASISPIVYILLLYVLSWLSISAYLLDLDWLFDKQRAERSQLTAATVSLMVSELRVSQNRQTFYATLE